MNNLPHPLEKFVKSGSIFVFSKSFCPFCDKAKQLLKVLNVKFSTVEVDTDKSLKSNTEFLNSLKSHSKIDTYPKIYIGIECLGGFTDLRTLYQNGKLYEKLKQENISFTPKL
jgi:glutaredoxin 3